MKRKVNNAYLEYSHKAHLEIWGETENQGIRYSLASRAQVCLDPGDPKHQKEAGVQGRKVFSNFLVL